MKIIKNLALVSTIYQLPYSIYKGLTPLTTYFLINTLNMNASQIREFSQLTTFLMILVPILLLCVYYRIGKKFDLKLIYRDVLFTFFIAGILINVVGYSIGVNTAVNLYNGYYLDEQLFSITLGIISNTFYNLILGFSAISLAYFHNNKKV